ncbi:MAG: EF2563 family selenium-dependent molybdenum hydroxylase system protein [Chloroflexi bacterium]|nr:EF2563 family selenium-dependent molybdenum hydroxylase system protein [Chloroflexota bacterium]
MYNDQFTLARRHRSHRQGRLWYRGESSLAGRQALTGRLSDLIVLIKGAGEVASAVAHRLARSNFKVCMTEMSEPQAVTRTVTFSEAVYDGEKVVDGVTAARVDSTAGIREAWAAKKVAVIVDPAARVRNEIKPDVVVDARMLKKNLDTTMSEAPLVIGLGPGFVAGRDVHVVIETNHSENLGKVILEGPAEKNTGIPVNIGGYTFERALHAPEDGLFSSSLKIGQRVKKGDIVGRVDGQPVRTEIDGILRALFRDGVMVQRGTKVAEVDPEGNREICFAIRDRMRAIGGGVLEAILMKFNN